MRQLGARMPELPALEEVPRDRPTRTPAASLPEPAQTAATADDPAPVPEPEVPARVPGRTRIHERIEDRVEERVPDRVQDNVQPTVPPVGAPPVQAPPVAPRDPAPPVAHVSVPPAQEIPAPIRPATAQEPGPDVRTAAPASSDPRSAPARPSDPPAARPAAAAQPVYGDELPFRKLGRPRFEELGEPRVDEMRFDDVRFRHVRFEDPPVQEEAAPARDATVRAGSILGLSSNYEPPRLSTRSRTALDDEPEHRFPFMTLAVPGLAAVLALGALLWSGALRDRMHQQDAAVSQLQEQNQRLEDALDQMARDNSDPHTPRTGPLPTTTHPSNAQDLVPPPDKPLNAPVAPVAAQPTPTQTTSDADTSSAPPAATPASTPAAPTPLRSGQSTPPPMTREAKRAATTGYHPQIVAPYPTTFRPANVADDRGASQASPTPGLAAGSPAPQAATTPTIPRTPSTSWRGATPAVSTPTVTSTKSAALTSTIASTPYHPPFTVAGNTAAPRASTPAAAAPTETTQYTATSNGAYVSPLAQNIEMVESLQRHSQVPLEEFHAREGLLTRVAPTLGVTVDRLDSGRGSFGLLVHSGSSSYQLHGQVNAPVTFSDAATNREYELVVLRIADQQVYGYVKPAH